MERWKFNLHKNEAINLITYKRCTEVKEEAIFQAFQIGFSDYMIKMDLPKDVFFRHFFGPEGNRLEYSVIAFDGDKPVGLNMGGIKEYEGVKTLRCGGFCVHPDYRGTGISGKLFELHKEIALENHCKQLFLEVIAGNDRAINFYKKQGYEKVYDLIYYSHSNPTEIRGTLDIDATIERIDMDGLRSLGGQIRDIHINWQNDMDYIGHFADQVHYGAFHDNKLIGALSIHPKGKISFLWVEPRYRHKGIGRTLVSRAVEELQPQKLSVNFPNNANLLGFAKRLNFSLDPISQYEMYITL